MDKANSNETEFEVIINRFLIDLELELGASFTERTTYTGIYNISDLGFDMSFRVQCSENYTVPHFVSQWRECTLVTVKGGLSVSKTTETQLPTAPLALAVAMIHCTTVLNAH